MNDGYKQHATVRRVRALVIASAFLLLIEGALILAAASPRPQAEAKSTDLRRALELDRIKLLSPEEAFRVALAWAREISAKRPITDKDVEGMLPEAAFFLARTCSDADVDDIREASVGSGAFARAYKAVDRALPGSNAAGLRVEAALGAIQGFRASASGLAARDAASPPRAARAEPLQAPVAPSQLWIASPEELKKTHQKALDVFFVGEDERGTSERGSVIRSMSSGIVVTAAGDWAGGEGSGSYRRGGLTPRAGNGVIIYDPEARRYYTYFHLRSVDVKPGQAVSPGSPLGQGGNTGTNARRRGHGGHLHLEIYDAASDKALDCYELRKLLFSLKTGLSPTDVVY